MKIEHPFVTIKRALHSLQKDEDVAQAATRMLERVWPTFEPAQHALLLGAHSFKALETMRNGLTTFLSVEGMTQGESAPSMLPGKRCWRRDDEEPPSRSHLMSLLDVLDFLSIYVSDDGFVEIRLLGESS